MPRRGVKSYQVSQVSTPAEDPPPSSGFFSSLWRRFLPRSPDLQTPVPKTPGPQTSGSRAPGFRTSSLRGAQPPNISSGLISQLANRAEIAIVTPDGLEIFANGPGQQNTTPARSNTPEDIESCSEGFNYSDESIASDGTYRMFDVDYKELVDFLGECGFSKVQRAKSKQNLEEQVKHFLTAARPVTISGDLVRFVIFTGHNSRVREEFSLYSKDGAGCTYSWNRLPDALKDVPQGVPVVIVLACCFAGDAVDTIERGLQAENSTKLVIVASSGRGEKSFASSYGDHALGALLGALQARNRCKCYNDWQSFEDLIKEKLELNRHVHTPEWRREHLQNPFVRVYNMGKLTPFDVFRGLIKHPLAPLPRPTKSAVVQVGNILPAEGSLHVGSASPGITVQ